MRDLGEAKYVTGIQIERNNEGIKIHQENYINQIFKKFKMTECKGKPTPLPSYKNPTRYFFRSKFCCKIYAETKSK